MKTIKFIPFLLAVIFLGCKEGYIDDISAVDPGPDMEDPEVEIVFPGEGQLIRVVEDVTDLNISFEASDDIEIEKVDLVLDGTNIATLTGFKDYRKAIEQYVQPGLANGAHTLTATVTDIAGKTASETVNFEKVEPYKPIYPDEIFYMPFDGEYVELITLKSATVVGSPGFAGESVQGTNAYAGAPGAYLTFPAADLLNDEFSAVMWYKLNADPNRAGIVVMGPEGFDSPPGTLNNGFKFFREAAGTDQRFKVNAGTGSGNSWFDGGDAADLDPAVDTDWQHLAFTIATDSVTVYINGEVVRTGPYAGIGWDDVAIMSIMSGEPNFQHWNHRSDLSYLDELRIFSRALTQAEIKGIIDDED